jgi:hypothetical protein
MNSPKRLARTAGFLYLLVAIFSAFAQIVRIAKVYVAGDAATTAQNVLANSDLVRLSVVADLFQATIWVFLAMALWRLLRHVNTNTASAMVTIVAIGAAITCLNMVFQFAGLRVALDASYAAAFGIAGSNALILLLFDMQHHGFLIAQIFFGLWLVPLGYLAYTSGMFPRALGVLLIVGGASYLVGMLAVFLLPDVGETINGMVAIAPTIAEVSMVGYLLVKGVRSSPQSEVVARSQTPAVSAPVAA